MESKRDVLAKDLRDLHEISGYPFHIEDSFAIADFIIAREEILKEALSEFGVHKPHCNKREMHEGVMRMGLSCDCGLDQAMEEPNK